MRTPVALAALLAALSLAGCGGDDESGSGGDRPAQRTGGDEPAQKAKGGAACIESWNANASPDVKGYTVAGVSEEDTMAGTYRGPEEFEAQTEAETVTVQPGDCVVAQVTSTETEYVFVESAPSPTRGKSWHNLEEEGTPLAKPGAAQLKDVVTAKLKGYGPEGKLEPNE
ncbi:MAG TPA: hypothetical protein VF517_06505 [Thermoleophilaceae bacterium]|jgi:hypothetical protein